MIPRIDLALIPFAEEAIFDVGPSLPVTFIDPDGHWMQISQRKPAEEGK